MKLARVGLTIAFGVVLASCTFQTSVATHTPEWSKPYDDISKQPGSAESGNPDSSREQSSTDQLPPLERLLNPAANHAAMQEEEATTAAPAGKRTKICAIMAGDSWSFFDAAYGATERRLRAVHPECKVAYSYSTTEDREERFQVPLVLPTTTARQWAHRENRYFLGKALDDPNHKDARLLILYLGGNDIIDRFNCHADERADCETLSDADARSIDDQAPNRCKVPSVFQPNHTSRLVEQIVADIKSLLAFVHSKRSDISVILVGYTKPNAKESLKFGPNRQRWLNMGCPTPKQLHKVVAQLADSLGTAFSGGTDAHYIRNHDLLAPSPTEGTPAAMMVNVDAAVFFWSFDFVDSIHLGKEGKYRVADRTVAKIVCEGLIDSADRGRCSERVRRALARPDPWY